MNVKKHCEHCGGVTHAAKHPELLEYKAIIYTLSLVVFFLLFQVINMYISFKK